MRLYIAGIQGMVGSAIATVAKGQDHEVIGKSSAQLDLRDRRSVYSELCTIRPDALVIAAAKVGGIFQNSRLPVEFLTDNLQIQSNLLDAANEVGIKRVLFLGSSCIYPKFAEQPIKESSLLTGRLEPTNESYAIAKIAGLKLVEAYRNQFERNWISIMPTNLYGPNDNFNLESAHVLPALIHRFYKAKIMNLPEVEIWGDGTPLREFLHVSDLARACMLLLDRYDDSEPINVGSGEEISISNLSQIIAETVGYDGSVTFNLEKPNGTPRKLLDSSKIISLGWSPKVNLSDGIKSTYTWFRSNSIEGGEQ